jgi:hypothetical protein
MKTQTALAMILSEIDRAEKLHPVWPKNHIHASAICAEEAGELIQAALNHNEHKGSTQYMITEAVHTAATAIRFLKNMEAENEPPQ